MLEPGLLSIYDTRYVSEIERKLELQLQTSSAQERCEIPSFFNFNEGAVDEFCIIFTSPVEGLFVASEAAWCPRRATSKSSF
jgi:hypothetical protein